MFVSHEQANALPCPTLGSGLGISAKSNTANFQSSGMPLRLLRYNANKRAVTVGYIRMCYAVGARLLCAAGRMAVKAIPLAWGERVGGRNGVEGAGSSCKR
jgi:hypothetical protein